ncbi:hypothetical protein FNV43_RR04855 [Rhamnella rubrinervis]|uniref:Uncharacterized protein n=1 Tax=Rhamnella rubrinervis TaxID=2594499 RepID=A0A8K0HMS7_9ROSA|nr:hypothetical protein FNV43_RR04855 [Rhamnella rubrinervis]
MASAETFPPNPTPSHGSIRSTAEPFVAQINPSIPPLTDPFQIIHPEPFLNLQPSSTPPPNNHGSNIQSMVDPISVPPPKPSSIAHENQGLNNMQPCQAHYMCMGEPSTVVPQQNQGLLSSTLEQILSQFIRLQPPPLQADYPSPPPHMGSFNFKVEPVVLHINSSVPLLSHDDQSNSQLNKTQSSSSSSQQPTPPLPPPPPPSKQEPNQPSNPPPPPPADQPLTVQPNQSLQGIPNYIKHQKVLKNAGSLANLLPTGTVLAFQALTPTLSDNGICQLTNKVLVACIIGVCSIICFLSSFTDSYDNGNKVYYGIATCKGLLVFNYDNFQEEEKIVGNELRNLRIRIIDYVHALGSLAVFLIFAFSSSEVQGCYFPRQSKETQYSTVIYLPLVAGILSSFLFTIFPTKRRGIGYTDLARGR